MKFESLIISRGSGSVGGLTFSRNKGGAYIRARVTPVDPGSTFQTAVRTAMSSLVNIWNDTLTQLQRDAWKSYADAVPLLDTFGQPRTVTALNMYTRSNVPRIQAALVRVDDAPIINNTGDVGAASVNFSAGANDIATTFDDTDAWPDEDDSAMLVYTGRPQNAGIQFFKGPYRLSQTILGDATTAPTSPALGTSSFPFEIGQRMFFQLRVSRADGRLSTIQRGTAIATS